MALKLNPFSNGTQLSLANVSNVLVPTLSQNYTNGTSLTFIQWYIACADIVFQVSAYLVPWTLPSFPSLQMAQRITAIRGVHAIPSTQILRLRQTLVRNTMSCHSKPAKLTSLDRRDSILQF